MLRGALAAISGREKNFGNAEKGSHTLPWGVPGLEKYHGDTINLTHALTLEALAALDHAREIGQPFFLYMSHYAVHVPLEADHRFYTKYKEAGLPEPEAFYASMVEAMDQSLGDLMDYLDRHGLTQNTVILFMSDNGGLSAEGREGNSIPITCRSAAAKDRLMKGDPRAYDRLLARKVNRPQYVMTTSSSRISSPPFWRWPASKSIKPFKKWMG